MGSLTDAAGNTGSANELAEIIKRALLATAYLLGMNSEGQTDELASLAVARLEGYGENAMSM